MAFVYKEERKFKSGADTTGDHIGPGAYAVRKKAPIKENFAPF